MKTFDDYGPPTDHPHDPRNEPDESGPEEEHTAEALDAAMAVLERASVAVGLLP